MENTENNKPIENSDSKNQTTENQPKLIWESIKTFLLELLSIRFDTDQKGTIEDIKGNISMKGHTAWVLVFSILININ